MAFMRIGGSGAAVSRASAAGRRLASAAMTWTMTLALGLVACGMAGDARAAAVRTEHVTAELVSERVAVQPGQPSWIGLKLQHIPHWHTYWRNPGDSGLPTTLAWSLPAGSSAGEIDWPAPQRLPIGPLVNYGYEGELLLPVRFTPPADAAPGNTLELKAQASWLVCREVCIPEKATLTLSLPVVASSGAPGAPSADAARFARHAAERPTALQGWITSVDRAGRELLLRIERQPDSDGPPSGSGAAGVLPASRVPTVHVFPYVEQLIEPARHEVYRTPAGYAVRLALADGAEPPPALTGIAVAQGAGQAARGTWAEGGRSAAEFSAPVREVAAIALPAGAERLQDSSAPSGSQAAIGAVSGPAGAQQAGLLAVLALAFAGGMLLNLMPCVFPVLSIKLVALARQPDASREALRAHAAAYAAGVVLSFVALAALLLALRAGGSAVGWGFQLQEPGVVFVLALLFFALGLNLMGAFEFGQLMPQRLAGWRAQRPSADAFASGVLAVVAASPCTAPFMGAALGFAITQSAALALGVFAALGAGMALPYALLVLLPGWRARLPRPGIWMLRFKQALAFPMFATVVWLVWVLGQQAGVDGAAKALLAMVGLAFVVWLSGLAAWRGLVGRVAGVAGLAVLLAWGWPLATTPAQADGDGEGRPAVPAPGAEAAWQPYDEAVIAERVAAGQPVFVDFTAAWCVSCQVNKRLVLNTDATQRAFQRANVALMRADWTQRDARITEALARLGRNGVPVYVLIRPGREPLLLPEILTGRIVEDALATLS